MARVNDGMLHSSESWCQSIMPLVILECHTMHARPVKLTLLRIVLPFISLHFLGLAPTLLVLQDQLCMYLYKWALTYAYRCKYKRVCVDISGST